MNSALRKTTGTGIGLLLVLLTGAPAMADDTELMLLTPDVVVKPNILFMLDTSGSMGSKVRTKEPYNPGVDYGATVPGSPCDSDAIYWTDVDITPSCASSQHLPKTEFECRAADGRLTGIGSYSDTMVQFRETADPNVKQWQELEAGNTSVVECMADSGVHGDGTVGAVYATNNGAQGGFTGDATQELAWGSAPATVTYTVYDGNYLNWKSSTAEVDVAKIDILKAVTKSVLSSISDVNVGIMRFNGDEGGVVIKAMSDLDADRASIIDKINGLAAAGNTPLAEFMYEAALYWRGAPAHFGANNLATDPAAVDAAGSYIPPDTPVCMRNFNVLVSDGLPQDADDQAPTLVANLPEFIGSCDGTGTGACLDDIAHNLFTVGEDEEKVTTHSIGFSLDIPSLEETANESGGTYFQADDVETLTTALLEIFSKIDATSMSFAAPSVSVNSFNRAQNLNDLYMAVFSAHPSVHWPGNVKKYRIADGQIVDATGDPAVDPDTGFFKATARSVWTPAAPDGSGDGFDVEEGGAAHHLPVPISRKLFTNSDAGALVDVNINTVTGAELGLTNAPGEPTLQELIDWMHGVDVRDENHDGLTTDTRFAMGDPLHSQPAAVVYGGDAAKPEVVVFVGTNDGYLHAIDGEKGNELWSFIPSELLGDMNRLFFDPESTFKHYGIDGSIVPVVFDADNDGIIETGQDFVRLVFGLRRGGNSYYALDVTDKNSPQLLWVKKYDNFGQTWSTPVIALVDTNDPDLGTETEDVVVIVGDGYDPVHDTPAYPTSDQDAQGAGIHMLDLATGARVWWAGPDGSDLPLPDMNRSIPTEIRVLDMSGDGYADRMYAADIGGQIWRFDISNGKTPAELVEGGVIARLGPEGTGTDLAAPRRFYNSPDIAIFNDPDQGRRFVSISIGSGYRAHPLNTAATDMFFSVRDEAVFNQLTEDDYANYDVANIDDLVMITPGTPATIGPEKRGWAYELPAQQAILADSLTFADSLFIVAFRPDVNTNNPCNPSAGVNLLYQVDVANGDFAVTNQDAVVGGADPEFATQLPQGGIAPSATPLFPGSTDADCKGAECAEPPILCVGTVCSAPPFDNHPVRTLWTQDGIQ
ncbi:MAG TPA: PilC/PilY family type IV pilus protein [Woeseiaceae bacterium]|nr:PilC/PilY family type IV pilus protein [Woeseiaceae bacterium]